MKSILLAILTAIVLSGCIQNGDGEKIGTVVRINKSGVLCPTDEVEIVRGGLSNGSGAVGGIFDATAEDPAILQKLKDAMEHQREVKITFTSEVFTLCRSGNHGNNFIRSVELMNTPTPTANGLSHAAVTGSTTPGSETRDQTINRLLATQAELLKELAGKQ